MDDEFFGAYPGGGGRGRGRGRGRGGNTPPRGRGRGRGGGNSGDSSFSARDASFSAGRGRGGGRGRGNIQGAANVRGGGSHGGEPVHNPHGTKSFAFNYAVLERRIAAQTGPSYVATPVADSQQQQNQPLRNPRSARSALGRGGKLQAMPPPPPPPGHRRSKYTQASYNGPNAHEHIIEGEDLQLERTTTFRSSGKSAAPAGTRTGLGGIVSVFGRSVNQNLGSSRISRPPVFVPATGDWINGAFVAFDGRSKIVVAVPEEDVDVDPETEQARAEALRPQGAGLGFGRPRATNGSAAQTRTQPRVLPEDDDPKSGTVQSRVEREQEELMQHKRDEAEQLLQELLREYAAAPPDGRAPGSGLTSEASTYDLPFAQPSMPSGRASQAEPPTPQADAAGEDEDEIILVPAPPAEHAALPTTSSTVDMTPPIDKMDLEEATESAGATPSTSDQTLQNGASHEKHIKVEKQAPASKEVSFRTPSPERKPVQEDSKTKDATESESEEEATEFDLSAMQSFVQSMDGQTGGKNIDLLDIAVETRIREEEAWETDSEDEAGPTPTKTTTSADKSTSLGKAEIEDYADDSEGSSAYVGTEASEDSSEMEAEALGRKRLAEQQKRRQGKGDPASGSIKKKSDEFDEDEIDEDGVEVHWGDTDEEEDESSDEDDEDEDDEDDDDDDDDDEDVEDEDDDEVEVDRSIGPSSRGFSWAKSDKDFMRQLETFADLDETQMSNGEKKERNRLFRAIERGEIYLEDDALALDDYDIQVLEHNALKRQKGKMRQLDESDLWAADLQEQWNKDRKRKAAKKAARQAEREAAASNPFGASHGINLGAGKLSKKAAKAARRAEKRADRSSRKERAALGLDDGDDDDGAKRGGFHAEDHALGSRFADNLVELNEQIQIFVRDGSKTTLSLPPMEKKARARVHELANAYNLNSKSVGMGKGRFTILTKGKASAGFRSVNMRKINWIVNGALGGGSFGLRGKKGGEGRSRGRDAASHASKNMEGAQVGFGAEKIGQENVGHKLLQAMGWSEGTGIGVVEGGSEPIQATIKTRKGGLGF